jgi:hypothetical protein
MDVQKVTHEIRLQQWARIVKECRSSGKSIQSWCTEQGVNVKQYFYWQRKLREAACQELSAYQGREVKAEPADAGPVFAECKIAEGHKTSGTAITIRLNDTVVEIHHGADAAVIESALRALKGLC